MPGRYIFVDYYKVEHTVRDVNGKIIPEVSVKAHNVDIQADETLCDGPFQMSMALESNVFSGTLVKFYLPQGTYDITYTNTANGDTFVLERHFVGNVHSLKQMDDGDLYTWQRHIVGNDGGVMSGLRVVVRKYIDTTDTIPYEFYPNKDFNNAVSSFVFDDYIMLSVDSGLYHITVSNTSGEVIQTFDHVSLGYTDYAELMPVEC